MTPAIVQKYMTMSQRLAGEECDYCHAVKGNRRWGGIETVQMCQMPTKAVLQCGVSTIQLEIRGGRRALPPQGCVSGERRFPRGRHCDDARAHRLPRAQRTDRVCVCGACGRRRGGLSDREGRRHCGQVECERRASVHGGDCGRAGRLVIARSHVPARYCQTVAVDLCWYRDGSVKNSAEHRESEE